jgi:diguanylate cyclase
LPLSNFAAGHDDSTIVAIVKVPGFMDDAQKGSDDSDGKWKDKYLDIINTLEAKQADAEASIELMQRYLKRWAQDFAPDAAVGEDPALSDALIEPNAVRLFLDRVESYVRPDDAAAEQRGSPFEDWLRLADLLNQQKLAKSLRTELKRFRQLTKAGELASPAADFEALLSIYFQQQGEPRGGLWQKLRKANALEEAQESSPVAEESGHSDSAQTDHNESQSEDLDSVRRQINGILYTLIDQIKVPEHFDERRNKLRADLNDIVQWSVLPNILSETTSLVFISNTVHQQEFGDFLQSLNTKLAEIHVTLDESREMESGALKVAEELGYQVRDSLDGLNAALDEYDDIRDLKHGVQLRLEKILSSFSEYQQNGMDNRGIVLEKLEQLTERMTVLEADSERLRAVIDQQRIEALRDSLTGLPNRQCYEEQAAREIARIKRYNDSLSLVVADIDHFKSINDKYGHVAGDRVLKLVAQAMVNRLRTSDIIARYGGEEFVILMPSTEIEDALNVTEQLREAIEKTKFHYQNGRVKITVSFGVTQVTPHDELEKAFLRADKALYQAKAGGRNCVHRAAVDGLPR